MTRLAFPLSLALAAVALAFAEAQTFERFEFTRMVAHWAEYADPEYLPFIEEAQPEVAQFGFYGATFWGLAHTPQYKGYPAHFPVQGLQECGAWFAEKNRQLHQRNVKVVGHFNVEFLFGDPDGPEGPRGFFKFYRDLWDESVLGPKPAADPVSFLEKDGEGKPIGQANYQIGGMGEYWACLRNPDWQKVLKAWVKYGIEQGVDGYVANYFYRHDCLCQHCQREFRQYLKTRHDADSLRKLGIDDVDQHRFTEIVSWHNPAESSPLRREMLRFSQVSNKQVFDEVFIRHGRALKPDLIVGQWNHLGNFSQISGDERCLLPADLWGKDETYLWYSTGGAACFSDLENRYLGDATLQARYIRGAFDNKPYTLGKYESTRIRMAIAELAANGGAPMGFYTRFKDPVARAEIARYYGFMRRYDALYKGNRPYAEAVLLFPRTRVHAGDVAAVEAFRKLGKALLERHVLFDVLPDDLAEPERLAAYGHVLKVDGGKTAEPLAGVSRFDAPWTVQVSASRPAGNERELTLHLVNYNREEPPKRNDTPSPGGGIHDEKPIAAPAVGADLVVPAGQRVAGVRAMTPEQPDAVPLQWQEADGRVRLTVPGFLVYAVVQIDLEPQP